MGREVEEDWMSGGRPIRIFDVLLLCNRPLVSHGGTAISIQKDYSSCLALHCVAYVAVGHDLRKNLYLRNPHVQNLTLKLIG